MEALKARWVDLLHAVSWPFSIRGWGCGHDHRDRDDHQGEPDTPHRLLLRRLQILAEEPLELARRPAVRSAHRTEARGSLTGTGPSARYKAFRMGLFGLD